MLTEYEKALAEYEEREKNPENYRHLVGIRKDPYGVISYINMFHMHPHRIGGPAVLSPYGVIQFWECGELHNENGPAIIWPCGKKEFRIKGSRLRIIEENGDVHIGKSHLMVRSFSEWDAIFREPEDELRERFGYRKYHTELNNELLKLWGIFKKHRGNK